MNGHRCRELWFETLVARCQSIRGPDVTLPTGVRRRLVLAVRRRTDEPAGCVGMSTPRSGGRKMLSSVPATSAASSSKFVWICACGRRRRNITTATRSGRQRWGPRTGWRGLGPGRKQLQMRGICFHRPASDTGHARAYRPHMRCAWWQDATGHTNSASCSGGSFWTHSEPGRSSTCSSSSSDGLHLGHLRGFDHDKGGVVRLP